MKLTTDKLRKIINWEIADNKIHTISPKILNKAFNSILDTIEDSSYLFNIDSTTWNGEESFAKLQEVREKGGLIMFSGVPVQWLQERTGVAHISSSVDSDKNPVDQLRIESAVITIDNDYNLAVDGSDFFFTKEGDGTKFLSDDGTYYTIQQGTASSSLPQIDLGLITGDSYELMPPYPETDKNGIIDMLTFLWDKKNEPLIFITYSWNKKNGPEDEVVKLAGLATHRIDESTGKTRHVWEMNAVPYDFETGNPNAEYVYNFKLTFPGSLTEIMTIIAIGGFKAQDYITLKRVPIGSSSELDVVAESLFTPITFEVTEDESYVDFTPITEDVKIEYKVDGGEWITLDCGSGEFTPYLDAGQKISFRGRLTPVEGEGIGKFSSSCPVHVTGCPTSMLFAEDAYYHKEVPVWGLAKMFENFANLLNAPELPSTDIGAFGYYYMFSGCTSLTKTPEIKATQVGQFACSFMFQGCTSLTEATPLYANTLSGDCYNEMFKDCTALVTPPKLYAQNLAYNCYFGMFLNCTSMEVAPKLPATTLAESCYGFMFQNCTSLKECPVLPARELVKNCYMAMFYGCSSMTTVNELPAETLVEGCYNYMFTDCVKLNYINAMFLDIPGMASNADWVTNVAASGTYVKNTNAKYADTYTGSSAIPFGWTVTKGSPSAVYTLKRR